MHCMLPDEGVPPEERGREVRAFWTMFGVGILLGMGIMAVGMMVALLMFCEECDD